MNFDIKVEGSLCHCKKIKVIKVLKKNGNSVEVNDILFELESDKGTTSIKAKNKGVIENIKVNEGDEISSSAILASLISEKEDIKGIDVNGAPSNKTNNINTFSYFGNMLKPIKTEIECDIAILGGGPGGYVAAIHAAKSSAKVVIIEKENLGGTCLNWGCIPTKALVRSAEVLETLKHSDEFGIFAENIRFDMKKVMERKDKVVNKLVQGVNYLMEKNNIKVVKGFGEFIDQNTIKVKSGSSETEIRAKNIIIATGSKVSELAVKGKDLKNVIDSNEALNLKEVPKNLVIIGGGVIGMEFAHIYASFGSKVTVIEYLADCLSMCDKDISDEIKRASKAKGIKIYTGSKLEEIYESEENKCIVRFTNDNKNKYIVADKVLLAVGRTPIVDGFEIEKTGVELYKNKKGIQVDECMKTNVDNIYAIGDVTNIVQLAHVASHQGIIAVNNILGKKCKMEYDVIPSGIFTSPEIGIVGVNEKTATDNKIEVEVSKFPLAANGKSLAYGESDGFVKIIKDKKTNRLIGGSIIGLHATDLIAEIALAVKNNLTAADVIETIHAHPTTAEIIHEACLGLEGGAIHLA